MLFRHASMQKIRHCCQNLNLLPYLLYSFDNSKSHPLARKMHVYLNRFLQELTLTLITYENLRQLAQRGLSAKSPIVAHDAIAESSDDLARPAARFSRFEKPKRKSHPFYLVAAVYLVPLLLIFQVITLCSLTILGKYTPGFIFLISALLFLGGIALKILLHETVLRGDQRCERKKIQ